MKKSKHVLKVAHLIPAQNNEAKRGKIVLPKLSQFRFSVTLITLSKSNAKQLFTNDVNICYLSAPPLDSFRWKPFFLLFKVLKDKGIHILHCHGLIPSLYGTMHAVFDHKSRVVICDLLDEKDLRFIADKFWVRRGLQKVDAINVRNSALTNEREYDHSVPYTKICTIQERPRELSSERKATNISYINAKPLEIPYMAKNVFTSFDDLYKNMAHLKRILYDFYLISYPKCGRTWLRTLIAKILSESYNVKLSKRDFFSLEKYSEKCTDIPSIRVTHDPDADTTADNSENFLKDLIQHRYQNENIIFLVRDPRDVLVSHYFQSTRRPKKQGEYYDKDISAFIREPFFGIDAILKFYNVWAAQRHLPNNFLLVKYEDMWQDTKKEIQRVCKFVGLNDISNNVMEEAVNFASFANMKNMESQKRFQASLMQPGSVDDPESYKARKGEIHGFYDYLSKNDIQYLNEKMNSDLNNFFGYNVD